MNGTDKTGHEARPGNLKQYLQDPWLAELMSEIKDAGPMKSSLLDLTHKCNLRCEGCYYFSQEMDHYQKPADEAEFDAFVAAEKARGTNMLTVVGGEPALELGRLRKLAKHFRLTVVTNGSLPIPTEGLEQIRIAVSFWGDELRDTLLRGNGSRNIFQQALAHFKDDPRVGFYYTTVAGYTEQIEATVERMVENGNFVSFNFYADLAEKGGAYDHRRGFAEVNRIIRRLSLRFPRQIMSSPYSNQIIDQGHLFGQPWGYEVCPSLSYDHPKNQARMKTGKHYPTQFRAYYADLKTTRPCCIGEARDCATCTDVWASYAWIVGSMKAHLNHERDFQAWLFTTYIFYASSGFIDWHHAARRHLPAIYQRFAEWDESDQSSQLMCRQEHASRFDKSMKIFPIMAVAELERQYG